MTHAESRRKERGGLSRIELAWVSFFRYFALLFAFWFAVTAFVPFEPYSILGYRAIPPQGCPGKQVEAHLRRDAKRPPLGWITRVDLDLRWQEVSTGTILLSATFTDVFNGQYGVDEDAIGILSASPDRPGEWRIITTAKVKGVELLMPNEQVTSHVTDQIFTLLPNDHPDCIVAPPDE